MRKKFSLLQLIRRSLIAFCLTWCCAYGATAQNGDLADAGLNESALKANNSARLKAVPLRVFMQEIQRSYGIYFSYHSDALKETMVIYDLSQKKVNNDPAKILGKVLATGGLVYQKVDKVYVIKPAVEPVIIPVSLLHSSSKQIERPVDFVVKGNVKDNNGNVAGITVEEKGTSRASVTDASGNFSINVSSADAILVFSSVGYKAVELAVGGRSVINVTLESGKAEELSNVVVTALGISRNKKTLGYSVGEVKAEDLVKASNINLLKSLDGKVSGVNFTNVSSDPTSSVLVNIRGTTALPTLGDRNVALKGQPLYVIDGIPVGTQTVTTKDNVDFGNILSQLNPEDIDNITILKGGSAGALYGKEGGNGVIMITTKSGKGGRKGLGVSFNHSNVWDKPFNFMPVQMEYGPGPRADTWALDGTDTWGPRLDGTTTSDFWNVKTQKWDNKAMYSSGENPVEAYLQTGRTITNNISVQGNYDKGSFRLSLSNMDNKGVMPNTKTDQKSISLNSEYRLTNKVKISVSASYINTYSPNKARIQGGGDDAVLNTLLYAWPTSLQPLSQMHDYWLKGFEDRLIMP